MVPRSIFNEFSRGFPELANPWLTKYWKQKNIHCQNCWSRSLFFFYFSTFCFKKKKHFAYYILQDATPFFYYSPTYNSLTAMQLKRLVFLFCEKLCR